MPTTRARRQLQRLWKQGIGLPGDNAKILNVARHLRDHVSAPVLGGIAVILHGYPRTTIDLDLYTSDHVLTDEQLRSAGGSWDVANREHVVDGVRIHTVTPEDARHVVAGTSILSRIRVVSLKDLIAIKLRTGLRHVHRAKDIGDVTELITRVPLDNTFAPKLPKDLRVDFKRLVDAVQSAERARRDQPRF